MKDAIDLTGHVFTGPEKARRTARQIIALRESGAIYIPGTWCRECGSLPEFSHPAECGTGTDTFRMVGHSVASITIPAALIAAMDEARRQGVRLTVQKANVTEVNLLVAQLTQYARQNRVTVRIDRDLPGTVTENYTKSATDPSTGRVTETQHSRKVRRAHTIRFQFLAD